jgi:hypothetical protein
VIAANVSACLNIQEQHVNAQRSQQIALVPIVNCRATTKCAQDMASANAISVNVKARIRAIFAKTHRGMRHLIRYVSSTRLVYNVLLTENSSTNVPITRRYVRRQRRMECSINQIFMTISQVR